MNYYNPPEARRKVFLSYFHRDDQAYKDAFERAFGGIFINKSVRAGDISTDVSTEYIKRLIQSADYLADASVLIVFCGPNTKGRKHVDWEIYGALDRRLNGYSGIIGVLLPTFPLGLGNRYNYDDLPPRLADNVKTGYAKVYTWTDITQSNATVQEAVEIAFRNRTRDDLIDNSRIQMQRNTTGL